MLRGLGCWLECGRCSVSSVWPMFAEAVVHFCVFAVLFSMRWKCHGAFWQRRSSAPELEKKVLPTIVFSLFSLGRC
uniref:Uncharacterized protein n=1 Tax=Arundo donax TaxID=35708 RepID=A0A0A8ZP42_ARUDO